MARSSPTGRGRAPGTGHRAPAPCRNPGIPAPAHRSGGGERGFTLATLLVLLTVMAVFLTVAIESVSFQQRREKEQELIFRGTQFVEGVRLFRVRFARYPVKLEELAKANPRVLRKNWADPMTGKTDWQPVFLGEAGTTVQPTPNPSTTPQPTPNASPTPQPTPDPDAPFEPTPSPIGGQGAVGTIVGVKSRLCDNSIAVYQGHTRYCDWKFYFDPNNPMGNAPVVILPTPAATPTPGF